jgi:beta-galactosidase
VPVQCYASYDRVELFVNGVSHGRQGRYRKGRVLQSNYRFLWPDVPYEPGELKVVAYDKHGNTLAEARVVTAGEPAAIELVADRAGVRADGEDMAFLTARILDSEGALCPRAANAISFQVKGPGEIAGLCNGDATSLESFKGRRMKAFNGLCVLYLQSVDGESGRIEVTASSDGLAEGRTVLMAPDKNVSTG